jgi:FtsP/CotA-like multicopper oxidase with cupredoxin domain
MHAAPSTKPAAVNPCGDTDTMYSSTNLHFHGLNIPPVCHQDDTITTLLQVGEPSFQYQIRIPKNDPPGMFWYHPHPHGFSETQVLGGASGVIIINGMEQVKPETAGLPQQVMVIRDELIPGTTPAPAKSHPVSSNTPAAPVATKQLTVNYIPIVPPYTVVPVITMKPSEKQFWRVANASADTFLDLQVQIAGKAETVELIALDGVPTSTVTQVSDILLPPGGRGEFIMQGPPAGVAADFVSLAVTTGYGGDVDPFRPIAKIVAGASAVEPVTRVPAAPANAGPKRFDSLISQTPTTQRKLYFSEIDPSTPPLTQFFITVEGQTPVVYSPSNPPAIVTTIGAVEDWTIENHALEDHAFHIHQLHYLLLETNGVAETTPMMLDTVRVSHWDGKSSTYPSVKIRMDFRDPDIAGTFVYHCHILEHEDAGMMAKIQVNPAPAKP